MTIQHLKAAFHEGAIDADAVPKEAADAVLDGLLRDLFPQKPTETESNDDSH